MANPFQVKFDSTCQSCEAQVWEGDLMFAAQGLFICGSCAHEAEVVCSCGNFKKPEFDKCFACNQPKEDENEGWDPWADNAPKEKDDLPF